MKKEIGTLENLVSIIIILSLIGTLSFVIGLHLNHKPYIIYEPIIIEKKVYVPVEPVIVQNHILFHHKLYEYRYCDFRGSLDTECKTIVSPFKLEEFDTGASWLNLIE